MRFKLQTHTNYFWRVAVRNNVHAPNWSHWEPFSAVNAPQSAVQWDAKWISGGRTTVPNIICGTANGCTGGNMFLACDDPGAIITNITFAAFGNPTECPVPTYGDCNVNGSDARGIVEKLCLKRTNCTVHTSDFKYDPHDLPCLVHAQNKIVIATAVCSPTGPPANQLRKVFTLDGPVVHATASVSALGYQILWCNGKRVGSKELEPGRSNGVRAYFSSFDLSECLQQGPNVLAVRMGNGWFANAGNQPGSMQSPPLLLLQASIEVQGSGTTGSAAAGGVTPSNPAAGVLSRSIQIVSDSSWRSHGGMITQDSVFLGETQNLTLDTAGWTNTSFDDVHWLPAIEYPEAPPSFNDPPMLTPQIRPAIVEAMVLPALSMTTPTEGHSFRGSSVPSASGHPSSVNQPLIFDFGQNFAGKLRLRVRVPADDAGGAGELRTITVRHAEVLNHLPLAPTKDGKPFYGELMNAVSIDTYTVRVADAVGERPGTEESSFKYIFLQPEFTIHGFRFASVTGLAAHTEITVDDVHGVVMGANISTTNGESLRFSHPVLNKVQHATVWSHRANTQDIPTDCNQRDERLGWMGDAGLAVESAMYNLGGAGDSAAATFISWLDMIADEQGVDGALSDVIPNIWPLGSMQPADPNWGSAYPTIAYTCWQFTADDDILKKHIDNLVQYIDSLEVIANHTGLAQFPAKYADWLSPFASASGGGGRPDVNKHLVSASAVIHDTRIVKLMAAHLGTLAYNATAARLEKLEMRFTEEFNAAWLRTSSSSSPPSSSPSSSTAASYAGGQQTELALPLWLGIVPASARAGVVQALVVDAIDTHKGHVTTGIVGVRAIFEALSMNGRTDIALQLACGTTYPSFGWMVTNPDEPATTLWEQFGASTLAGDQGDSSRNHIMFGTISAWYWKYLLGVTPLSPGFGRVSIAPHIVTTAPDPPPPPKGINITCVIGKEEQDLAVGCPAGHMIDKIIFAEYGTLEGNCALERLTKGKCALDMAAALTARCTGKQSCRFRCDQDGDNRCTVEGKVLVPSPDPCEEVTKKVAVQVNCTAKTASATTAAPATPKFRAPRASSGQRMSRLALAIGINGGIDGGSVASTDASDHGISADSVVVSSAATSSTSPLLTHASGSLHTVRGDVTVSWRQWLVGGGGSLSGGTASSSADAPSIDTGAATTSIELNVSIPVGIAGGEIFLPCIDGASAVTLGGEVIWKDGALLSSAAKAHGVAAAVYDGSTSSLALAVPASGAFAFSWAASNQGPGSGQV
jgi:alpha-L-rhamnosidase